MSTENQKEVIDLTPKQIKDKSNFKLTNADISANYFNDKFHLMLNDFKGAFVCWATKQNPNDTYGVIADATQAYTKFLQQRYFKTKDTVIEMDCDLIKKLTDEDLFVAIPEILALNQMKPDFICLGALSRNVFYHILREQITRPVGITANVEPINYYEICKELAVKNAWIQQSVRKEVIRYDRFVIDEPLPQNQIELLKEGVTRFSFDLVNFFTIHEYLEMRKTTAN